MTRDRATLKDIAEGTGFSANTVSLALRNSPRIPENTRRIILREAERLNYRPNHIARSLVSSATKTIGLVMTELLNPTLTLAAHTIERELSRAGYAVMFAASEHDVQREKRAIELFQSYRVDGMLLYPASRTRYDHIRAVETGGTPVLLLVNIEGSGLDTVTIDDRAGAARVFRHLCDRGHRVFAMLDGGQSSGSSDKAEGARQAVRERGLPDDAITVFATNSHAAAAGYDLMPRIAALVPRPTAVFASTDSLALGVLQWCRDNGLSVPGDIAVVGYDNTETARFTVPPLTTVDYAADDISRIGVRRMLDRLEGRDHWDGPQTRLIMPDLVLRQTA